jgi:hypothetical protein
VPETMVCPGQTTAIQFRCRRHGRGLPIPSDPISDPPEPDLSRKCPIQSQCAKRDFRSGRYLVFAARGGCLAILGPQGIAFEGRSWERLQVFGGEVG